MALPGRLSALSVFHSKYSLSRFCMGAQGANGPKRRFPARADSGRQSGRARPRPRPRVHRKPPTAGGCGGRRGLGVPAALRRAERATCCAPLSLSLSVSLWRSVSLPPSVSRCLPSITLSGEMGGRAGQRIFAGCGLPRLRAFAGGLVLSQWRSLALVNLR
jgi:hypothetical protein